MKDPEPDEEPWGEGWPDMKLYAFAVCALVAAYGLFVFVTACQFLNP